MHSSHECVCLTHVDIKKIYGLLMQQWCLIWVSCMWLTGCHVPHIFVNLGQQHHLVDGWRHFSSRSLQQLRLKCAFVFQICLKGKVHIFKYLNIQACRTDKKPDTLDLPSLGKRCLPQPLTDRYFLCFFKTYDLCLQTPFAKDPASCYSMYTQCMYMSSLFLHISSMEDFYPSKNHGPDSGIGSDNGDKRLSTTEVRIQTLSINHGILPMQD